MAMRALETDREVIVMRSIFAPRTRDDMDGFMDTFDNEEYPQPKYGRGSCANRGEPETHLVLCYGEQDPRWPQETTERPRYE